MPHAAAVISVAAIMPQAMGSGKPPAGRIKPRRAVSIDCFSTKRNEQAV
jgi:hypothetical protein